MYKELGTTLITGSTLTGKTCYIQRYLNEILSEDDNKIFIIDLKMVELHQYKNKENVTYLDTLDEFDKKIYDQVMKDKKTKKYIFIDEYAEVKICEDVHKKIKKLLKNKEELNLVIVCTSQLKISFCKGMRNNANTEIHLNKRHYFNK